ncbi:VWA domain-containing protein, partial [Klebsiella pneumoniae]
MRRLPVYLLLDTSGSMHGEPIEAVKNGVQTLLTTLKQDPYALETAYVSVITFDSTARQAVPLTDLLSFNLPSFSASGTTA